MYYRQQFDTFIRRYGDIGYIKNTLTFTDRVVDASGAVFLDALSRTPKTIEEITAEISLSFIDVPATLRNDIEEFYGVLEEDGFIVSGQTPAELDRKEKRFSYATVVLPYGSNRPDQFVLRADRESQSFLSAYFKDNPHLVSMQIELTSQCNERCVHCYIPFAKRSPEIEVALFDDVLRQANDMGLLSLTLSGGEPFLHSQFLTLLNHAMAYDFSLTILSNLTLLTDEIRASLKSAHISTVSVSLYSLDHRVHDAITCRSGSHAKTMRSIASLIEDDVRVQINCPVMRENKDSLAEVYAWATERGIQVISDYGIVARYDSSTDNLDHRLSASEVEPIIWDMVRGDGGYQARLEDASIDALLATDRSNEPVCGVCTSAMSMVADGTFYPCPGWQGRKLGNAREQTLEDIWGNSPAVRYLRSIRRKDFPKCLSCADRAFCSICMVRNANESPTGDPLDVNPYFCQVAAVNRRVVEQWMSQRPKVAT